MNLRNNRFKDPEPIASNILTIVGTSMETNLLQSVILQCLKKGFLPSLDDIYAFFKTKENLFARKFIPKDRDLATVSFISH